MFELNLQERNEKDAMQYAAELKELQRTLDHDEKLKDFLFHKSNDRAFAADLVDYLISFNYFTFIAFKFWFYFKNVILSEL